MQKISRKMAVEMIKSAGSQIFTVTYLKRSDGSRRVMNARLKVSKGVKGVGMSFNPSSHGLITVYDMQSKGHRMVSIEGIQELKISGNEFVVV